MVAKPPPRQEIKPPPRPPEPHRTPIQNEPKQTKTQAVQQRLDLAAKAAAQGNMQAAANYANAAVNIQKTGKGSNASLQRVQGAYEKYQGLAITAQRGPTPGPTPVPTPGPTPGSESSSISSSAPTSAPPSPVLIPGRDALNFATSGVVNALTSFIFEDLAGTEIITLMKRDTIDGIDPNYSIISNISDARRTFDPTSLLSKKSKTDSYFDIFGIQLLDKIPDDEYLAKNSIVNYYYIASNGDLVIELDNLSPDERVEIEIATNGTINELDNS